MHLFRKTLRKLSMLPVLIFTSDFLGQSLAALFLPITPPVNKDIIYHDIYIQLIRP